jgi:hypothetical protein
VVRRRSAERSHPARGHTLPPGPWSRRPLRLPVLRSHPVRQRNRGPRRNARSTVCSGSARLVPPRALSQLREHARRCERDRLVHRRRGDPDGVKATHRRAPGGVDCEGRPAYGRSPDQPRWPSSHRCAGVVDPRGVPAHPPQLRSAPSAGVDDDHEDAFTETGCALLLMQTRSYLIRLRDVARCGCRTGHPRRRPAASLYGGRGA